MEIVIIGAGTIGYTIARTLSKRYSVTVVEEDEDRYNYIVENLDVGALNANGASPQVLKRLINGRTKLVIAVTAKDEVNIFACMVAKHIKRDIITVARVRNEDYVNDDLLRLYVEVDHMISPERIIAAKMSKLVTMENLIDYECFSNLGIEMATFIIKERHRPSTTTPLSKFPTPQDFKVVLIRREDKVIVPKGEDFFLVGDKVTLVAKGDGLKEFNRSIGEKVRPNDFIVIGGGLVGENLAKRLEKGKASVKLIEEDLSTCERLSKTLERTIIINDKGADPSVLSGEGVNNADALIAVTENEEENLLSCLISKHMGVPKVVSLYSKRDYEDVFHMKEMDVTIGYYHVVANEINKLMAPEFKVLVSMNGFAEEFISLKVASTSYVKDMTISDIDLPERTIIAMVVHEGSVQIPRPETTLMEGDLVLVYASINDVSQLERLFDARIPVVS